MSNERLSVVMVGAGNLATNLAVAMVAAGMEVRQVWSRTEASAERLAGLVGCPFTTDVSGLDDAALYVVCVSDKAISSLLPSVVAGHEGAVFCHTAGSVPMGVFEGYGVRDYGVLYPMQTFTKGRTVDFGGIPLFVEHSSPRAAAVLSDVARHLSRRVMEADSVTRGLLHLASVVACNFSNRLYALAGRLLAERGIPFDVLLPLIDETVAKVHAIPPALAQTGPAARGDTNVIDKHRSLLSGDAELLEIYDVMTKSIMDGRDKL